MPRSSAAAKAKVIKFSTLQENKKNLVELNGFVNAISKSQAMIEFNMDGTIVNANDNFLGAIGYALSEIVGQHHRMFCEPGYAISAQYQAFWAKLNRGEFDTAEYKRLGKNGKEIWIQASYNPIFDLNGKPFKVVKFATDITKQKLVNAEFEGKVTAISKSQAVIEFNMDGTIIDANENFLGAVGYNLSEIKGQHHRMFCEPGYAVSSQYQAFWAKLNRGEFDTAEYKRLGKNGKEIWIQASYNPILDPNGKPFKVVKFATEVTELRKAIIALDEMAVGLSAAASEMNQIANDVSANAKQTNDEADSSTRFAQEVAGGVQVVATNTEEMVSSIKEIARSANESAQMSHETLASAKETNRIISDLGVSSQEIGNVIKVISSIAQQTNLLALNATIEAARAGDAGKGFAVVANEVKELAKQTAKATEDITTRIGAIQTDTTSAVKAISLISERIEKLNSISGSIASSVEEQTATTNEVSRVVSQSADGVKKITQSIVTVSQAANAGLKSSGDTLKAAQNLMKTSASLRELLSKIQSRSV